MFGTEVKFSKTCLSGVFLVHFLHVFSAIFFVIISVDIALVLERQKIWFLKFPGYTFIIYKQSIFDPRPENFLSLSKKSP